MTIPTQTTGDSITRAVAWRAAARALSTRSPRALRSIPRSSTTWVGPRLPQSYVASSAGLFRGELSSGVWTWTDISGSLGLPTASPWRAVTYNPSPTSPCAEEFYGATGDQIFRIRECGSGYVSTLISPAPFEDVHALLWDELVVGTAGGLWSLGHASKDVTSCRASFDKARDKYMTDATKIGLGCRVRELEGGGTCPDSVATASIAKAESRIDLSKKCSDGLVAGLSDSWDGLCRGVANVEDLETCLVSQVDDSAEEALAGYFGASGTTTATSDGSCEESLGKAYGRVLKIGLKAISKCERKIDKDKETNCPNAEVEALIAKQGTKALRKISWSCTDANAVALEARGLPDGCVGVNTVASMHACLMDASGELISALVSPAETEF